MATKQSLLSLDDALAEVEARFLLQLPDSELIRPDRLLFWIQEASWFYDDFFADNNSHLPRFTFKSFTKAIFGHCPLFNGMGNNVDEIFREFGMYRSKIPVHGCIVLNPEMTKVLLVCSWNGNSWTFPRGKVNENEAPIKCAIREMQEETGFDVTPYIHENDAIRFDDDGCVIELFIVTNVPETTKFNPLVRKEISKIEFFYMNSLPEKIFAVKQFIPELKKWIKRRKEKQPRGFHFTSPTPNAKREKIITSGSGSDNNRSSSTGALGSTKGNPTTTNSTTNTASGNANTSGGRSGKKILLNESALFNARNSDTFDGDGSKRWSVNAMFAANAQLTGNKFQEYDGNPHNFGASHPRYVDYNNNNNNHHSSNNSSNVSPSTARVNDFSQLASQSEEFHKFRGTEDIQTLLDAPSQGPPKKAVALSKKAKKAVAVAVAEAGDVTSELLNDANQPSNLKEVSVEQIIHASTLFPSPFRLDVKKIMARIDQSIAVSASRRNP